MYQSVPECSVIFILEYTDICHSSHYTPVHLYTCTPNTFTLMFSYTYTRHVHCTAYTLHVHCIYTYTYTAFSSICQTIEITIIDDDGWEPDEMFRIELSNPSDGYGIGEFHTAEITIIDDDRPSSIKLAEANVACSETNGTVDIQVLT